MYGRASGKTTFRETVGKKFYFGNTFLIATEAALCVTWAGIGTQKPPALCVTVATIQFGSVVCTMKTVLNSDQDYTIDLVNYLQPRDKEQQQKPRLLDSSLSSRYFVPSGTS